MGRCLVSAFVRLLVLVVASYETWPLQIPLVFLQPI